MSQFATITGRPGRLIAVSLKPGASLTTSLEEICAEHGVVTAFISSAVGTIEEIWLRNPKDTTTLPIGKEHEWAPEIDTVHLQRKMEILSLQGNITMLDGSLWAHCHGVFSDAGANLRGGHVFRATIWSQGEILLTELLDARIDRKKDTVVTGLPQIRLHADTPN